MERETRALLNKKRIEKGIRIGHPLKNDLQEGLPEYRYIKGKGIVQYLKYNNIIYSNDMLPETIGNVSPQEDLDPSRDSDIDRTFGEDVFAYEVRSANFSETADNEMYIPLSSQSLTESNTTTSGLNEFLWFITPFEGWIEKIQFRSVEAHNGTLKYEIFKYIDAVDSSSTSPTETGEFSETINIADDIVHTTNIGSMTPASGSNYIAKNILVGIKMTTPSNPGDTNVSVTFRWLIN